MKPVSQVNVIYSLKRDAMVYFNGATSVLAELNEFPEQ